MTSKARDNSFWPKVGYFLLISTLLLMGLLNYSSRASAYVLLGQKWSTTTIKYYIPSPLSSYATWTGAASTWAGLDASLSYSSSNPQITVTQENRGNTVSWTGVARKPGTVQAYPSYSGQYWTAGGMELVLNWSLMTSLGYTSDQKKMVAAHEFGHAFGLSHNGNSYPGGAPVALMYPYDANRIAFGIYSPRPDDKAGINAIY